MYRSNGWEYALINWTAWMAVSFRNGNKPSRHSVYRHQWRTTNTQWQVLPGFFGCKHPRNWENSFLPRPNDGQGLVHVEPNHGYPRLGLFEPTFLWFPADKWTVSCPKAPVSEWHAWMTHTCNVHSLQHRVLSSSGRWSIWIVAFFRFFCSFDGDSVSPEGLSSA